MDTPPGHKKRHYYRYIAGSEYSTRRGTFNISPAFFVHREGYLGQVLSWARVTLSDIFLTVEASFVNAYVRCIFNLFTWNIKSERRLPTSNYRGRFAGIINQKYQEYIIDVRLRPSAVITTQYILSSFSSAVI